MTIFRIKERRATASAWTLANTVLAAGQFGVELAVAPDDVKFKIGDGVTAWNDLPYKSGIGPQGPAGPAGGAPVVQIASTNVTLSDDTSDLTVAMTTGVASKMVTLPTAADNTGRRITIKKVDAGAGSVVVDGEGAETIDGSTTYTINAQYAFVTVQSDGSNWMIIG